MLIVFEIRNELMSPQAARCLAETPPFWNLAEHFCVTETGTVEQVLEMVKSKPSQNRAARRKPKLKEVPPPA